MLERFTPLLKDKEAAVMEVLFPQGQYFWVVEAVSAVERHTGEKL